MSAAAPRHAEVPALDDTAVVIARFRRELAQVVRQLTRRLPANDNHGV